MGCKNIDNFADAVGCVTNALNSIIPIIIGFALVLFLFGLLKYVLAGADEKARTEGRNYIIFGIVALFVMVSVWGLVAILTNTFFGAEGFGIPQLK